METIASIEERFEKERKQLTERYREALKDLLKTSGLDKGVIRIEDGKEGVLVVESEYYKVLGYEIKFYPLTKSGKVSQKSSGWFWDLKGFKPKGGD